jgi:MFS family permease
MTVSAVPTTSAAADGAPAKAKAILGTLIIVAAVANLPLAMANVSLPSIGAYSDPSQTQLNFVVVTYALGLACSVLWLCAYGDRCGRRRMAPIGAARPCSSSRSGMMNAQGSPATIRRTKHS